MCVTYIRVLHNGSNINNIIVVCRFLFFFRKKEEEKDFCLFKCVRKETEGRDVIIIILFQLTTHTKKKEMEFLSLEG